MANPLLRLSQNSPGPLYVTEDCIDCDLCRSFASTIFTRDDSIGYSIVARQPSDSEEWEAAQEAIESCPADAIGKDEEERPNSLSVKSATNGN
jgi:ferredoxin